MADRANSSRTLARFSPEMRLVLACLRWPVGEAEADAIREAAALVRDHEHLVAIVQRHRVAGLVSNGLTTADVLTGTPAAQHIRVMAARQAHLGLMLAAESVRLQRLFRSSGMDPIFLKGAAVAILAYGNLGMRHAKDIDLLLTEEQVRAAIPLLREAGYVPASDPDLLPPGRLQMWLRHGKSMDWHHSTNGVQLELHWHMTDLPAVDDAAYREVRRQVTITPGAAITALGSEHLLPYLCVHGAGHGWMRLKWLADIYALLPWQNDAELAECYRNAKSAGAGRAAAQAILLCHELLQMPLNVALRRELEALPLMGRLRGSAWNLLARGNETTEVDDLPFGSSLVVASRFLLVDDLRSLALELRTWAYRPDEFIQTRLPRRLFFLFPAVRTMKWLVSRLRHGGRTAPQKT